MTHTTTLNPTIKAQWIIALRSGTYFQGRGSLRNKGAYCCLGVLCELYAITHPTLSTSWIPDMHDGVSDGFLTGRHQLFPPDSVLEWATLDDATMHVVSKLNDINGLSFAAIADELEQMEPVT